MHDGRETRKKMCIFQLHDVINGPIVVIILDKTHDDFRQPALDILETWRLASIM